MYFEEAFEKIKASLVKAKPTPKPEHYAIQVRITDFDCGGTFYIEQKDGTFYVEPYNYFDFDTDIEIAFKDMKALADGKLDLTVALDKGNLVINGDYDRFISYCDSLKKPKRKCATKKAPEKKEATTAKKKAPAKKTAKTTK